MNRNNASRQMQGALLAFVVLQLIYLFSFFITFPDSFRNAVGMHDGAVDTIASWLSTLTMLGYCVTCLGAVAQLVMRKPAFLLWFQISGAVALGGNFLVYILRQVSGGRYFLSEIDYYWVLFIMALFWTVIWCLYFARSSRVFSYMGEDDSYLRMAVFTKNVKAPEPWVDTRINYPVYPPYPVNQQPPPPPGVPPMSPQQPYQAGGQPVYPPQTPPMPPQGGYMAAPPQPVTQQPPPGVGYPPQQGPQGYPQNPYPPQGPPPEGQQGQNYPGQP